jgi:RNA polymerase sigma-70 factor, ECF subfamily
MLGGAVVTKSASTVTGWETPAGMVASDACPFASSLEERTSEALVAAAKDGDSEAFMVILDVHDRMLRSIAFRILGDRDQMDDVLQDVALKAFVGLPKFRGDSSLATWLYRIAYTTCLNRLRGVRRTVSLPDPEEEDEHRLHSVLSSADNADAVIRRVELAAALASLTPQQRAVVALVLEGGLDHHTAAEVLGIPMGTLASRLAAARTALRRFLREPVLTGEG